jgi:hypothetical protein
MEMISISICAVFLFLRLVERLSLLHLKESGNIGMVHL